jgi:hypothetical protein
MVTRLLAGEQRQLKLSSLVALRASVAPAMKRAAARMATLCSITSQTWRDNFSYLLSQALYEAYVREQDNRQRGRAFAAARIQVRRCAFPGLLDDDLSS